MGSFQGHGLFSIYQETFLAIIWILIFLILQRFGILPKIGRKMTPLGIMTVLVFILFIPNSTYAFWEIKHLIFRYKVAVNPDIFSYLVFGGISLIGLITSVFGTRMIIDHYAVSSNERVKYNLILSSICGFGTLSGQLSLNSWDVLNLTKFFSVILSLPQHPLPFFAAVLTIVLIFVINYTLDFFLKPS